MGLDDSSTPMFSRPLESVLLLLVLVLVGCGPHISESRMAFYPGREANCSLQFVQADMNQMGPSGQWEVVGYVMVFETGMVDPFSEEYRQLVRPRACGMGGEAVTIMQSTTSQGLMGSGSGTAYGVLRPRKAASGQAPQQF